MNCDCGTCCNACGHYPGCTSNQTTPDEDEENPMPSTDAVFAAAADATTWTRTNLGPRTEISHDGYLWTVDLPATGSGPARITGRHGYGGTEHIVVQATPGQTIGIVDAAMASLRP